MGEESRADKDLYNNIIRKIIENYIQSFDTIVVFFNRVLMVKVLVLVMLDLEMALLML